MGNCTFLRSRRTRRPKLTSWNWMRDFCKVPPTTRSQQTIKNKAQVGLITHTQWFEMLKTSIFLIVAWEKMCKQYVQVVLLQEAKGKVVVKIPTTQKFCSMVLNHRPMLQVKKMSMKILIKAVKFWISWTYPRHLQVLHTKTFLVASSPTFCIWFFRFFRTTNAGGGNNHWPLSDQPEYQRSHLHHFIWSFILRCSRLERLECHGVNTIVEPKSNLREHQCFDTVFDGWKNGIFHCEIPEHNRPGAYWHHCPGWTQRISQKHPPIHGGNERKWPQIQNFAQSESKIDVHCLCQKNQILGLRKSSWSSEAFSATYQ